MRIFLDKPRNKKHIIIQRMEPWWLEWGHEIVWSPRTAEVQLCMVKIETETDLPKVLRLDGIYYGRDEERNRALSRAHKKCNGIIYQSKWCKEAAEKVLKPRKEDAIWKIIYNGIKPLPERFAVKPRNEYKIVAVSRWRRWKRLREITKIFKSVVRHYKDLNISLHVFGDSYGLKKPKNDSIMFYEKVSREEMFNYFLNANCGIHIAKNDWCPNSVVEMLGFRLPVLVSSASGGAKEIIDMTPNGGAIVEEGNPSLDHDPYSEEWNKMSSEVEEEAVHELVELIQSRLVPEVPEQLLIENVAKEYITIMEGIQ